MPLPIVANLFLVRLHWTSNQAPRAAVNDLFIHDDAGGHTGNDVYTALNANIFRAMWENVNSTAVVDKVITTKLDGTAASVDHATGSTITWTGVGGTDPILQGCQVVTLRTGFRGRSRRGRIYLPWIAEDTQASGTIDSTRTATCQTNWDTFRANMKTAGFPLHVCSRLHNDSVEVSSITVQPFLKTQRRRTRR